MAENLSLRHPPAFPGTGMGSTRKTTTGPMLTPLPESSFSGLPPSSRCRSRRKKVSDLFSGSSGGRDAPEIRASDRFVSTHAGGPVRGMERNLPASRFLLPGNSDFAEPSATQRREPIFPRIHTISSLFSKGKEPKFPGEPDPCGGEGLSSFFQEFFLNFIGGRTIDFPEKQSILTLYFPFFQPSNL